MSGNQYTRIARDRETINVEFVTDLCITASPNLYKVKTLSKSLQIFKYILNYFNKFTS